MAEEDIKQFAQKLEADGNQTCNELAYQGIRTKGLSPEDETMRKKHFDVCLFGYKKGVEGVLKGLRGEGFTKVTR